MIVLRDYQHDARDALWDYFAENTGHPLVLMPTGTGKSIVIGDFVRSCILAHPGTRIIAATHVETLIDQNFKKLLQLWPTAPAGVYSAGLNRRELKQITFAGIQSVHDKALAFGHVDILLVDEAHLVGTNDQTMYLHFINALREINPNLKVIGLTATGWRIGMGSLVGGGIFTDVAIDMTTRAAWNWFVDCGYLASLSAKKTRYALDASGVKISGGEYVLSQLQAAVDKEAVTRQAVQEMVEWGEDRNRWLVFATGVEHCEHVADMLNEYGVSAVAVHSKLKGKEAQIRLADFKAGKYRAAVSMNKLTTGVDVPEIDLIGVLRHTASSALWVQMLGRGTRPMYASGYNLDTVEGRLAAIAAGSKPRGCLVLDFARNTERLGPVNDPVMPNPKSRKKGGMCPVRVCPVCAEYVHASLRSCPFCGCEFTLSVKIEGHASTAEVMARGAAPDPVVELVEIHHVTYAVHKRRNSSKPPSLRVSYYLPGLMRKFEEYICFEHEGSAKTFALNWWRERVAPEDREELDVPATVQEAADHAQRLRVPKKMRVWTNTQHPRIMSYEY